jgi:uncharacterized cupredoxin-like copper-binding protein
VRPWSPLAVLVLAAAVGVSGCGGVQVGQRRTLQVAITEYRIDPGAASAPPGRLTLVVQNDGRLKHNLVIVRDGHPQAATAPLAPGGRTRLRVVLRRGEYKLESTFGGDAKFGAQAYLTIR